MSPQHVVWILAALLLVGAIAYIGLRLRAARIQRAQDMESLRLTRSLLRSLDQGVVVADDQGTIRIVNEAAQRMLGSLSDTLSRRGWAASGGQEPAGAPGAPEAPGSLPIARAVAGESFEDEEFFVRRAPEAQGRWLLVSGGPLLTHGGSAAGGVVVFRDITAKKAQDDHVQRLTAAVDNAADAIFMTDRGGRIFYVNKGFEHTTGYASDEAIGRTPDFLGSGDAEAGLVRDTWDAILHGQTHHSTLTGRRRDGSVWHADQTVTPVQDTQGQVTHFVSVMRDVTQHQLLLQQEAAMRVAGIVQRRLYPADTREYERLDLAGAVVPLDVTCGDYFDVIPLANGDVTLVIGDVSGHGIGPALIMVETRAHLRSLLGAGFSLDDAFGRLNDLLGEDIPGDRFVTLLAVRIAADARSLTYANAGHPPALMMGGSGQVLAEFEPTGPALGLLGPARYRDGGQYTLSCGDVIALVTDGITELHSPQGELFEWQRVVDVVREHRAQGARLIVQALRDAAVAFAAGYPADDDLTLLLCKIVAVEAPSGSDARPTATRASNA